MVRQEIVSDQSWRIYNVNILNKIKITLNLYIQTIFKGADSRAFESLSKIIQAKFALKQVARESKVNFFLYI